MSNTHLVPAVMKKIDVYGHIGLPRFTTPEEFLAVMDREEVERALLSTAQFCPDVLALSRAVCDHPDRFRALGLPLGSDRASVRSSVAAQLDSGFSGIRILARTAQDDPQLLDIVGRHGKFVLVVSFEAWTPYCDLLADFLDRYPRSFIIGGHFAGPCDPRLLEHPAMARLYGHERFVVAFTRQGLMEPALLLPWARALIDRLGWRRILWGSEWPVAAWRDESYRETTAFIEQFDPDAEARRLFFHDNAERLIFADPPPAARQLDAQWDLMPYKVPSHVSLFPKSLQLPEPLQQRLLHAYLADGADARCRYSEFALEMIERGLASASAKFGSV